MKKRAKKKPEAPALAPAPAPKPFLCEWKCAGIVGSTKAAYFGNGEHSCGMFFRAVSGGNFPSDSKLPFPPDVLNPIQPGMTLKIRVEAFA